MQFFGVVPILLTISIMATEFATGLYLPSLPLIGAFFGVSDEVVSPTVSLNLLGLALSGPFYGPLSDSYGRRPVLLGGMFLFVFGSFLCLFHHSLTFLMVARFIQGLGEGVAAVLSLATIKDIYDEEECSQVYSIMDMGIVLIPAIAPIIGGFISGAYGWHTNFYVMLTISLCAWGVLLMKFPETHEKQYRHRFSTRILIKTYTKLARNQDFIGNAVVSGLVFGGLWVFISGAPYLFVEQLNVSVTQYSYYSSMGVLTYILGSWLNSVWVESLGVKRLLSMGLYAMSGAALLLIFIAWIMPHSPFMIALTAALYTGPMAFVFVNTGTRAMQALPDFTGYSAALLLAFEMGISGLSAEMTGYIYENSFMPLALLMAGHAFLSLLIFFFLERQKSQKLKTGLSA